MSDTPRKDGHSKLVYDKATRTIVSVDPHPDMSDTPGTGVKLFVWTRDGMQEAPSHEELSYVMRQAHERAVKDIEREHANALGTAAQSDVLYAQVLLSQRNLKHALLASVEVIKAWHNMPIPGGRKLPDAVMEETWRIYYENAPEMKLIRDAIK